MKRICAAIATLFLLGYWASPKTKAVGAGRLSIQVAAVDEARGGTLIIRLHDKETWGDDPIRTLTLPVPNPDGYEATLHALDTPKEYALQVLHDENGNGKMDLRLLPWPKPLEGGGFSNNYIPKSKPKYRRAAFDLAARELTVRVEMTYRRDRQADDAPFEPELD